MLYDVRKYEIPLCTLDGHAPFGVFKLRIHESPDSTPVVLQPVRPDQPSKSQPAEPAAPKQQQIVVEKSVEKPLPKPQPAVKPAPELTEKTSNNAPLKTTELITNDEYDDENSRRKMTKSVRFVDEAVESQPLNESFSIEPLITELKKVASDINRSSSESTKLQLESVMDAVNDLKFRLHEDLQNMHVEMLRQFQQQQVCVVIIIIPIL